MKILHSIGSFVNGGVETLLVSMANRQSRSGHDVSIMIITSKWSQDMINLLDKKINIYKINKPIGSYNPWYLLKLNYFYKKINADVLHLHGTRSEKYYLPQNFNENRIITIHNESIPIHFSNRVDQYIAISNCVLDSFKEKTKHDNCRVCYNGVESDKFLIKKEYKSAPQKLLMLGRIEFDVKGQDLVLKGISKLSPSIKNDIHIDIWGDGSDIDKMKILVDELNLQDQVTICGNIDNVFVSQHLCDYDLMIQASHHEGLGLAAIESMMSKVPILTSDAKGFIEVTNNGTYGQMFKHSDINSFVSSFEDLYNNYSVAVDMADKAYDYALSKFSMDAYMNEIMKVYNMKL